MAPDIAEMLHQGQQAIFNALGELRQEVKSIAVQQNEIDHIKLDVGELKEEVTEYKNRTVQVEKNCITYHGPDRRATTEKPLIEKAKEAAVIAIVAGSAVTLFGLIIFILVVNIPGFVDFQRTQIDKPAALPMEKKHDPVPRR